ncbi:MAG: phosphatase PAP2 family protein [Planctomycetota bacterium]|nr:MAG: phosphatase PAP2 family protein [Planctomycetota bacterium]
MSTSRRWLIGAAGWLGVVVALGLLLKYDVAMMRFRYWLIPERPEGMVRQVLHGFREFAQIVPIVAALIMVAIYDKKRRWKVIAIVLVAQLLGSIVYNTGKFTIARYRPNAEVEMIKDLSTLTPAETWIGWRPGNGDKQTQSFPSGHSGAAFALAGVLAWFYPPLRWLLWILAGGCAASRYLDAVHWPSDCLAGAVIGYLAAWVSLRLFKQRNKDIQPARK